MHDDAYVGFPVSGRVSLIMAGISGNSGMEGWGFRFKFRRGLEGFGSKAAGFRPQGSAFRVLGVG